VNVPFAHPPHVTGQPMLYGLLSHASLERRPRCRSLDHLADAVDMIGRRPLVDHHTYTPKVRVSTQQPRGLDEERGLASTQR
jgi:hypothetical protein